MTDVKSLIDVMPFGVNTLGDKQWMLKGDVLLG